MSYKRELYIKKIFHEIIDMENEIIYKKKNEQYQIDLIDDDDDINTEYDRIIETNPDKCFICKEKYINIIKDTIIITKLISKILNKYHLPDDIIEHIKNIYAQSIIDKYDNLFIRKEKRGMSYTTFYHHMCNKCYYIRMYFWYTKYKKYPTLRHDGEIFINNAWTYLYNGLVNWKNYTENLVVYYKKRSNLPKIYSCNYNTVNKNLAAYNL